ncbi:MAG: glycosyltransferase family 4 protein [Alphaproteobacteria bacterium]|nr:glycosyltransferase family 4 protein [Alphaproteobacteria bacterium]
MTVRLAYLVTHPIHYQAPMIRRVAAEPDIDLTVFFGSDFSTRSHVDAGFGRAVTWDVALTDGFRHEFLAEVSKPLQPGEDTDFWRPRNRGLAGRLKQFDALWVHGYHRAFHLQTMLQARMAGLRVLLRDEATSISAQRSALKQAVKRAFFWGVDRLVDGYLCIGSLNRDYYRSWGIAEAKLFDMPYAVDNDAFFARAQVARSRREAFRAELGLDHRPVLLFSGKLIARKRPFDVVDAVATLPADQRPWVLFAGDGELRDALSERIAALQLERVRLLGFQSQLQLAALYDLADIFVLPSEREAWGMVVNEAMTGGTAILVSDRIGAAPDLVKPGINGAHYPVGDTAALGAALGDLVRDPARLAAMGQASADLIAGWNYDRDIRGLRAALGLSAR